MSNNKRPIILCILDGWGHRDDGADNAIDKANAPNWQRFQTQYPHSLLQASEHYVGLPDGQMGNSEVGHMGIGAGRVVYQDLPRINLAIADGDLAQHPVLLAAISQLKQSGKAMHLMGLVSPGGVHSHSDHLQALLKIFTDQGVKTYVHAFLDGRDTPPKSAKQYIASLPAAHIATIAGRFYAMDRDQRAERTAAAYQAIAFADAKKFTDPLTAIQEFYDAGITDEFIPPAANADYQGMQDGDGLLMFNFRADRARQILSCFLQQNLACKIGMTDYSSELSKHFATLFPAQSVTDSLGEIIAKQELKQLRIAETEKYAHITFFFNGGREEPFAGEQRILVPSPKVATYDLQPEMAAREVTAQLIAAVEKDDFSLVVVNYANTDMVGHTGNQVATQKAVECVDACLGQLEKLVLDQGGVLLVTSDHGNAEMMLDPKTGEPHTAHTLNLVPFLVIGLGDAKVRDGTLADIAPTVLNLLGIPIPNIMSGRDLLILTP